MKKYLILIAYEPDGWDGAPDEVQERMQQHLAFHREVGADLLAGEALADRETATTLRRDGDGDGAVLTDGPFAETAEMIGGFYLVQADDLDQVVRWCELLPASYTLEVRPCIQIDGFD